MQAWRELGLIVIVVAITMLMFSTLLFAFESSGPAPEVLQEIFQSSKLWKLSSSVIIFSYFKGLGFPNTLILVWGFLDLIY